MSAYVTISRASLKFKAYFEVLVFKGMTYGKDGKKGNQAKLPDHCRFRLWLPTNPFTGAFALVGISPRSYSVG